MQRLLKLSLRAGARVFDLLQVWRLDSGDYATVAEAVMRTWERRAAEAAAEDPLRAPLPRPRFMHSNLKDVDMVLDMCRCLPAGSKWIAAGSKWIQRVGSGSAVCLTINTALQLAKSGPGRAVHRSPAAKLAVCCSQLCRVT